MGMFSLKDLSWNDHNTTITHWYSLMHFRKALGPLSSDVLAKSPFQADKSNSSGNPTNRTCFAKAAA